MATRTKKPSDLTRAMLETAAGMHRVGVMSDERYRKITLGHLGPEAAESEAPIAPEDIRAMREAAHLSQAVFARYLNLTPGYVSQLERGTKQPTGAALALLNVVRRKGIEVLR